MKIKDASSAFANLWWLFFRFLTFQWLNKPCIWSTIHNTIRYKILCITLNIMASWQLDLLQLPGARSSGGTEGTGPPHWHHRQHEHSDTIAGCVRCTRNRGRTGRDWKSGGGSRAVCDAARHAGRLTDAGESPGDVRGPTEQQQRELQSCQECPSPQMFLKHCSMPKGGSRKKCRQTT